MDTRRSCASKARRSRGSDDGPSHETALSFPSVWINVHLWFRAILSCHTQIPAIRCTLIGESGLCPQKK